MQLEPSSDTEPFRIQFSNVFVVLRDLLSKIQNVTKIESQIAIFYKTSSTIHKYSNKF